MLVVLTESLSMSLGNKALFQPIKTGEILLYFLVNYVIFRNFCQTTDNIFFMIDPPTQPFLVPTL
jgi:hypothetical protein